MLLFSLFVKLSLKSFFNFSKLLSFVKTPKSLSLCLISFAVNEFMSTSVSSLICADTQIRFERLSFNALSQ